MKNYRFVWLMATVAVLFSCHSCQKQSGVPHTQEQVKEQPITQGVWVTVFSKDKVLYSKEAALRLIDFCKQKNISEIYLQIYRGGEAFYDSRLLGNKEYSKIVKAFNGDAIDYIAREARKSNIRIYAWINVLSLAQNKNAPILQKYGPSVLTRDKNLRTSIKNQDPDDSDKFYLRDDQLFLEPGDERVVQYTLDIVEEVVARYPLLSGIHLDYIRYPHPVPFIPDSRFMDFGINYGFGERNIENFKAVTGFNPRRDNMHQNDLWLEWDDWKRDQVTNLVKQISTLIRSRTTGWRISCAVIPSQERAYLIAYQDWMSWIENGIVDYVVLMAYTKDDKLLLRAIKNALGSFDHTKIYVGLGSFLFKEVQGMQRQFALASQLKPGGIAFFSYDAIYEEDSTSQNRK